MNNISSVEKDLFLNTYRRLPLEIERGEGMYIFDKSGNKYLDLFSGLSVNALGHLHPHVVKAVRDQSEKFLHVSNFFVTDIQIEFTQKLLKYSGMAKAFLTNSGTECTEAALKMIRKKYGSEKKIISFTNSFHGRSYAGMSLTPKAVYREQFQPLLEGISYLEFNNIENLNRLDETVAAVFIEPVQGEGGIIPADNKFIEELIRLRNRYSYAIVVDEIQTGAGRTGSFLASENYGIQADIVLLAKSIGGGLPLGAVLVKENFGEIFSPGEHGSTFGGNPLACAAGNAVISELMEKGLLEKVRLNSEYFFLKLNELKNNYPGRITEVRGLGMMIGIEMRNNCKSLADRFLEEKILINCTSENVIRLLPPLIIEKEHIDQFINIFRKFL